VIAEFFARQNNACIEAFRSKGGDAAEPPPGIKNAGRSNTSSGGSLGGGGAGGASTKVISFSHFVPRQELCPEKRLLWEPQLTKVSFGCCRDDRLVVFLHPGYVCVLQEGTGFGRVERGGTLSRFALLRGFSGCSRWFWKLRLLS